MTLDQTKLAQPASASTMTLVDQDSLVVGRGLDLGVAVGKAAYPRTRAPSG